MKVNLIYGSPGTGKTTHLMGILEKELKLFKPQQIAFCSFTKKGCYEGVERAKKKFNIPRRKLINFKTIHALAFRYANVSRDQMIKKEDYKELGSLLGMKFHGFYTEDFVGRDDEYLFFEQLYRNNKNVGDKMISDLNPRMVNFVVKNYRNYKSKKMIYDYTDLLEIYLANGEPLDCKVAIVDEAQDLTQLQWQVVWKLFSNVERVYIAGDDDQAIYEWSGADVKYFLNLEGDATILDHSWRLPKKIHEYALKISSGIENRINKRFNCREGEEGEVSLIKSFNDLTFNSEETFLFLSRNKKHLKPVEQMLREKGFAYEIHGESSINNELVKAIRLFSIGEHEGNDLLFQKFCLTDVNYNVPWYEAFDRLKEDTATYYRDLIKNKRELDSNIILSTIHGSKGGEAENVILILDYSKKVAENYVYNNDSEMRCYYVGATRAKKRLFLKEPDTNNHYPVLL